MFEVGRPIPTDPSLLLPIRSGDRVLILGEAMQLADVATTQNVTSIVVVPAGRGEKVGNGKRWLPGQAVSSQRSLPLATASIDHVIAPQITHEQSDWVLTEVARVLKSGGWLFAYVRNTGWTGRFGRWAGMPEHTSTVTPELSLRACVRLLEQSRLTVLNRYGVHGDLERASYLVPLEHPGAVRYFFQRLFVPRSWQASMLQRGATVLTAAGLPQALFSHIAIVAQHTPILRG